MPVPTETLWNIRRLNVVFALTSIATLGSMGWMLWHDYNRDWRHMQINYFNVRSAMAHFDSLNYETPPEKAKREKLLDAVDKAQHLLDTPDVKKAEKDLLDRQDRLAGQSQGMALNYGNKNAELQVMLFHVEEYKTLFGREDPRTVAAEKEYSAAEKELADLKENLDKLDDKIRAVKGEVKELYRPRTDAQKALAAYDKGRNDAKRLEAMYGPGLKRMAFNMPGVDNYPPKGVPGREEIKQVFMKNIRFNYNFVDSYVTDRCMTCHVSIDDPNFTMEAFVKRTAAALTTKPVADVLLPENQRLSRELAQRLASVDPTDREGKPLARIDLIRRLVGVASDYLASTKRPRISVEQVEKALADKKELTPGLVNDQIQAEAMKIFEVKLPVSADGKRTFPFAQLTTEQQMAYVASLTAAMNLYLEHEGRPKIDFRKELKAHPHLELYLTPNSPHPLRQVGCTVCHEGSGQETDFVLAAHTPKNPKEKKEWEEKYYVREAGVPLATFHLVEEYWERPMVLPGYTSASCRKCHQQTFDLEQYKALPLESANRDTHVTRVIAGREMFTTIGCINCHAVEGLTDSRRVGPDLAHVAEKLTPGFMERWIEYPANFRPSTRMPHFFMQENNLPSSANEFDPDPILRTQTEISAITQYLRTFSTPADLLPTPTGLTGDSKHGEELFTSIGCLACHANLDAKDPVDSEHRTFGERWIVPDLMHEQGMTADAAKAAFQKMTKNERVRYASHNLTPERRAEATKKRDAEEKSADREGRDPDPKKMYVPASFTRFAPELSGLGTKMIPDAGDTASAAHATNWMYNWLRDPRHYSSYTKMPRLFRDNYYQNLDEAERRKKNDQDILDVSAFLLSLRNDDFKTGVTPSDERHQKEMHDLVMGLLTGQNTEAVSEMIAKDEKAVPTEPYGKLTATIVQQVAHVFGEGDIGKQKAARLIDQKCPKLEDRQKLFLGMKMISHYGCYACHNIAGFEDATRPGTELSQWAQKFMSQLDFAFYSPPFEHDVEEQVEVFGKLYRETPEMSHLIRDMGSNPAQEVLYNHGSFAYHKLRNPRIWDRKKIKKPYDKLKMPNFFFSDEEARSLVAFLLSMKDANVTKAVQIAYDNTPAGKLAKGRALIHELNCIGCHTIENNEANIQQYYLKDSGPDDNYPFGVRFKPPLLWGEGAKVQYPWLFTFLNNVEMLRPWLRARMPSFFLTPEQTRTVVEYFAGQSQNESKVLQTELAGITKYLQDVHSANDSSKAGSAAWFVQDKLAGQRDFVERYCETKNQCRHFDFNPGDASDATSVATALGANFDKMVNRLGFLANLYSVQYPFTDPQVHGIISDARFKLGEAFLYDQRCLSCHVAGDPKAPGTTPDIKAPNFALAYKRLRYDWVLSWLQDPQAIQPGANMPQIFQGGSAYAGLPADQRAAKEKEFGKTVGEEAPLLVDFLFAIGARNYTAVQPGGVSTAQPAQNAAPAGDFDFDAPAGGDKKAGANEKNPAAGGKKPTSQPADKGFDF